MKVLTFSKIHNGVITNKARVEKRKRLRALMLAAKWDDVKTEFNFHPNFLKGKNGDAFIDWTRIPFHIYGILKCGGKIKETLYTVKGGIYHPEQKTRYKIPKQPTRLLIPREARVARHTLIERTPIRERLYESQKGECYYCGKQVLETKKWTIDHKLPISRGGTNEEFNLVGACELCNSLKSWMTEEEFRKTELFKTIKGHPESG